MVKFFYFLILLWIASSCNGQRSTALAENVKAAFAFERPTIPDSLTTPEQQEEYLAVHYWDHFDFTDTASIRHSEVTERIVADYLHLLQCIPCRKAVASLHGMMEKAQAEKRVFAYFTEVYERFLYEPASPFANDEWLIAVLEVVTCSSVPDEADKIRPAYLLEQLRKNRPGTPAVDFAFTGNDGQSGTLYGIDSEYLVLFFYNPDCHTCQETTTEMAASIFLQEKIAAGQVKVLAVYPEDDAEVWRNHRQAIPVSWINAYDGGGRLQEEELYAFRLFPTLYLLDKTKNVLLKEVDFQQIINFLQVKKNS